MAKKEPYTPLELQAAAEMGFMATAIKRDWREFQNEVNAVVISPFRADLPDLLAKVCQACQLSTICMERHDRRELSLVDNPLSMRSKGDAFGWHVHTKTIDNGDRVSFTQVTNGSRPQELGISLCRPEVAPTTLQLLLEKSAI